MDDLDALWAFLVAAAVALVLTPVAARLAHRVGAIDLPRERGLHDTPTPSLGGLAILAGVLVAGADLPAVERRDARHPRRRRGHRADRRGRRRQGGRAVAVREARGPARRGRDPRVRATCGWRTSRCRSSTRSTSATGASRSRCSGMVAVMNVVNFTDGVDGLAAGVCTIAAITFAVIALSLDRVDAGILAAAMAGACVGFLRHNFHPASIFMGDSGSNLLGLLLACVAIQGVLKTAAVVALFFPLVILAVPALDADLRGGQAAQVPPPGLLRRPLALPPPLREHRLLGHPHGALPVRLDGVAGRAGAGAAVRALLRGRRHAQRGLDPRDPQLLPASRSRPASTSSTRSRSSSSGASASASCETGELSEDEIERGDRARARDGRVRGGRDPRPLEDLHVRDRRAAPGSARSCASREVRRCESTALNVTFSSLG